ncbi:conjugal transfer protein TrbL [Agromyces sp. CFH 90414]|uniref:Conjugal transfer protein TrbL n=1 Tax=Agromyces agglutinans TaxID=2662258 RepID=A0A6I2F3K0_9MICO|nr:conjugal transfer protein TrbL [Agromyces agglutinans]MRG58801.1 conjugal transfer protein TrbL [Agromyces agglutinans]
MSVCDVPVIAEVCTAVGEGTASLVTAPFDWLAAAMGSAAAWMFEAVWTAFDTTTLVDVTDPSYLKVFNVLFGLAVFVTLIFFFLQLIAGMIHRDPTALSRAGIGLAKSTLGSFVIVTLTALLLEIIDQLTIGIVQATGNTMEGMGDRIALLAGGLTSIQIAAPGVGPIVTIFLAALAISAAAIVWFSLLIRKALLLVAVVFGPIALAGLTWDATKGWLPKWISFVVALVLSKLVLVVIFLVAIAQVAAPIDADLASISDPIAGIVLMFVAAFAPYITYKFLNFVGFDMYHAMSSEQEAKSALNRPVPVPGGPGLDSAKKILDGGKSADPGAQGGPAPTGATAGHAGARSTSGTGSTGSAASAAPASASSAGASAAGGAGAGSAAGAGAGGAASAAGPAGLAVAAGAQVAGAVARAAPRAGGAVAGTADTHLGSAAETASPPPPSAPVPTARSTTRPSMPSPRPSGAPASPPPRTGSKG